MKLKVKYLPNYSPEWERLGFAKQDDSGMDLRAAIDETIVLEAGQRAVIPNGIACELEGQDTNYEIQVRPRSGLAAKYGIIVVNTPGTVDWGYRGELKTILLNTGDTPFVIRAGDRIAQMVVCPIVRPVVQAVTELSETDRADGGFGSTGV